MAYAQPMLENHPWPGHVDRAALAECIEACVECAQSCSACADACLSEESVADLRKCIRLDLDCADVCDATNNILWCQTARTLRLTPALCGLDSLASWVGHRLRLDRPSPPASQSISAPTRSPLLVAPTCQAGCR